MADSTIKHTECEKILLELIKASEPFLSGDIVDETSGTIPLMQHLQVVIERAENYLEKE